MVNGSTPPVVVPPMLSLADLATLAQAIMAGVQQVQYADRMVRYASTAEMLKAYNFGLQLLGLGGRPWTQYAAFSKGLLGGCCGIEHAEGPAWDRWP